MIPENIYKNYNAAKINKQQWKDFGFMLEKDLPYQPSWFDKGQPCEAQNGKAYVDPFFFSHHGQADLMFYILFL